jgi:hypothetical protein
MFPVLVIVYLRLARSEEREVAGRLGGVWAARTPGFIPAALRHPARVMARTPGGQSHDWPILRNTGGVMAVRTARKRKAAPRPAMPRPPVARPHAPGPGTTLRAPTSKAAAPGLAAPRVMSLPAGPAAHGRVEVPVPASPVPPPAGGGSADGLFFAMAIGRQGCFFTGCCAGRPTGSRWGIWSSDGRIGARRIPAQQLESLVCLLLGAAALVAFLWFGRLAGGVVFIGAMAAYTLVRQGLLALRAEPRRWALARPVTIAVTATALFADILIAAMR